jgi:predicted ATPase/DNA-binding winged helix-turn-helix (wHTH) protein
LSSGFLFGRFEVRPTERQLLIDGVPASLGSRAFDLLMTLIERRNRVVDKNELLDLVWAGLVVEENNLHVQVNTLRKLLGPAVISTVPGRGYRFTAVLDDLALAEPAVAPAPVSVPATPPLRALSNLPSELPALIGREKDLADVSRLVRERRLVTLTGTGGIGKTRVARAVAHALRGEYADGAWSIELASVGDPANVCAAVAHTLGVHLSAAQAPEQRLAAALAGQRLLLVLDNCEHLLDSVSTLAEALLAGAPGIRLLATSQEPLKLPEEQQHRIGTLAVPESSDTVEAARYAAIDLFVERAQAMDPHFALNAKNLAAVIDICRHLDGIPLAIELAAARVSLLGVFGLRERLGERFRVLTAGSRFALRRHQTLHAALDWSYGLLSADEQAVFRRLGVFAGGCTLEAAQQAAADDRIDAWAVLEHLGALVDKSLVVAQGGDAPRYTLLETTRAFALERLAQAGETESLVRRHAQVMLAMFERADEERFGEQGTLSDDAFIDRAQPEIDNLRAALAWASGPGGDLALAIALAAASAEAFFTVGLAAEGVAVLRTLIPRVTPEVDCAIATRFWCAVSRVGLDGRIEDSAYVRAVDLAEQGCRRHDWPRRFYQTLVPKAWRLIRRDDIVAGEAVLAEAIRIEQPQWPGWLRSDRWNTQLHLQTQTGAFEGLQAVFETIAALLPPQGEERRRYRLILNTATHFNYRQQWDKAVSLLEPLVDGLRAQRRHPTAAWAYGHLVLALVQLGRLDDARRRLKEALPLWRAGGIEHVMAHVAIRLVVAEGRVADAMRLVGAEDASPHQFGRQDRLAAGIRAESQRLIEAAAPDAAQRERWRREGEALDEAAIVALCLGEPHGAPHPRLA